MAPKSAIYLTYGNDEDCTQTRQFLEEAGVVLEIRDIVKDPLNAYELKGVLGYLDAGHFINPSSESYAKHNLSESIPQRDELLNIIAEDNTLLKRPIIKTNRLMVVGCDKEKISEMLRLNGEPSARDISGNIRRHQNGSNRNYFKRSSSTKR